MSRPAYGLYKDGKLEATIRAESAHEAKAVFEWYREQYNLKGEEVRELGAT